MTSPADDDIVALCKQHDPVAIIVRYGKVVAAAGANAAAVAEHAMALLLACAKSIIALNERMHAGHWDKSMHKRTC